MSHLADIAHRHERDRWMDAFFIALAALLISISVVGLTLRAADKPLKGVWGVEVVESPIEVGH